MSSALGPSFTRSSIAAAILGLASAIGDWIWANYLTDGAIAPAIGHGVIFFALLGGVLAWAAAVPKTRRSRLALLPLVGLVLAGVFYPVAALAGYLGALLITWLGMWLALALLTDWARDIGIPRSSSVVRGLLAGIGSGLAFWAVSGMWTDPAFDGGYAVRFLYWTVAFLPGFVALLVGRPTAHDSSS